MIICYIIVMFRVVNFVIYVSFFSSAAGLQPAEHIVWVTDVWMDGWMSVIRLFSHRYSSYSVCLILTKVGTHDLHDNTKNFALKFFWRIFKILCQQQSCLS